MSADPKSAADQEPKCFSDWLQLDQLAIKKRVRLAHGANLTP